MKYTKITALFLCLAALFCHLSLPCFLRGSRQTDAQLCFYDAESTQNIKTSHEARVISSRFLELFTERSARSKGKPNQSKKLLIPSGNAFGVKIYGSGVRVTHIGQIGDDSPLLENDRIDKIDGARILTTADVKRIVSASDGKTLRLDIIRDGKHMTLSITPKLIGAEYSLGVIISDGASGIDTIT